MTGAANTKYKEYFNVVDPSGQLRYQSVYIDEAQAYCKYLYNRAARGGQTLICNIDRVTRA